MRVVVPRRVQNISADGADALNHFGKVCRHEHQLLFFVSLRCSQESVLGGFQQSAHMFCRSVSLDEAVMLLHSIWQPRFMPLHIRQQAVKLISFCRHQSLISKNQIMTHLHSSRLQIMHQSRQRRLSVGLLSLGHLCATPMHASLQASAFSGISSFVQQPVPQYMPSIRGLHSFPNLGARVAKVQLPVDLPFFPQGIEAAWRTHL